MTEPNFPALVAEVHAEFPDLRFVDKADSRFMRIAAWFLGAGFLTSYVTTVGNTVYLPTHWDGLSEATRCVILRHERVHMRQARRMTYPVFALFYLFVFLPVGLAFYRARFEMEAYAETLAAQKDYGLDYSSSKNREFIIEQFTSSAYGYMFPFRKTVAGWVDKEISRLDA